MKSLLFISTSSLAANPRLVKEFEALKTDFTCHVLCFKHQDWTLSLSEVIKARNPEVCFIEIERKRNVIQTVISKLAHKFAILCNKYIQENFKICAFANNDKALQLWFATKALQKQSNYTKVIAHNLGAFYAAVKISAKKDIGLQLDIEDYYPGEALYFNKKLEVRNRMQLMSQSFLKADTITYASVGIELECKKHFKVGLNTAQRTIINAFNAEDFVEPKENPSGKIKCVWFSQHIGPNRGLEQVFDAAKTLGHIEFHMIGNPNQDFLNTVDLSTNVTLHDIMKQDVLHEFLSRMDVGLALENVSADLNRDICLTNKFLAYAQAGLYILATPTFGQNQFIESLTYETGLIMKNALAKSLQQLEKNKLSTSAKRNRWQNAKVFSWENEQVKLKELMS